MSFSHLFKINLVVILTLFASVFLLDIKVSYASATQPICYPDIGCFPVPSGLDGGKMREKFLNYHRQAVEYVVDQIRKGNFSLTDGTYTGTFKTRHISRSGREQEYHFTRNVLTMIVCKNVHTFQYDGVCTNGAINYPACDQCLSGYSVINGMCRPGCPNGATNPPSCNICPAGSMMVNNVCICTNHATNPPACDICPSNMIMHNNLCVCANGATNPKQCDICPAGSTMVNGKCECTNNADIHQNCNVCKTGQVFNNQGQCVDACSIQNVCGQTKTGFLENGKCILSTGEEDPNASCIVKFEASSQSVNPNGSVEFSWRMADDIPSHIRYTCGFWDFTTSPARPVPGLQNLDPTLDRVRINNIQVTTRFCLVCKFFDLRQNNAPLGEAARHQWVRVIRVGEN